MHTNHTLILLRLQPRPTGMWEMPLARRERARHSVWSASDCVANFYANALPSFQIQPGSPIAAVAIEGHSDEHA